MGFVLMTFDTKQKSSNNKGQIMPSKKKKYNARFPAVSTDFEQPFFKCVVKLFLFLGAY